MKKIKLVILGLYLGLGSFGGVNNYTKLLLKNLDRTNLDVYYYSLGKSPNWYRGEDKPTLLKYIMIQFIKIIFFIIFLKKNKIEIVHLNPSFIWGALLRDIFILNISKMSGCHVLFYIRGWRWQFYYRIKKNSLFKKFFINNLKKADKILVLSKDFKQALVELGIDENIINITSTMVESSLYFPKNKTFEKPYKILFCGYMVKYKGPYELLDAIPEMLKYETNLNFIFMGDGPELENLKNKSRELGIEKNVCFTGDKSGEEKYNIFKSSHIFVLPSYTEGFPNVVLEAMATGLPIIATSVGGVKDVIQNGKNGFFIESNPPHPEDISNKILKMLNDPNMMVQISKLNINEALNKYDVKVVTKEILKTYISIIE